MKPKDKKRKGSTIIRRYDCPNPDCPSRINGRIVSVDTVETAVRYRTRVINSTSRTKRNKLCDRSQKRLELQD